MKYYFRFSGLNHFALLIWPALYNKERLSLSAISMWVRWTEDANGISRLDAYGVGSDSYRPLHNFATVPNI